MTISGIKYSQFLQAQINPPLDFKAWATMSSISRCSYLKNLYYEKAKRHSVYCWYGLTIKIQLLTKFLKLQTSIYTLSHKFLGKCPKIFHHNAWEWCFWLTCKEAISSKSQSERTRELYYRNHKYIEMGIELCLHFITTVFGITRHTWKLEWAKLEMLSSVLYL